MNSMTKLAVFGLVLAFSAGYASADYLTTRWPSVNKATCLGLTLWEDKSATIQGEVDLCVWGVIGGAIVLIGLWPQIGGGPST